MKKHVWIVTYDYPEDGLGEWTLGRYKTRQEARNVVKKSKLIGELPFIWRIYKEFLV